WPSARTNRNNGERTTTAHRRRQRRMADLVVACRSQGSLAKTAAMVAMLSTISAADRSRRSYGTLFAAGDSGRQLIRSGDREESPQQIETAEAVPECSRPQFTFESIANFLQHLLAFCQLVPLALDAEIVPAFVGLLPNVAREVLGFIGFGGVHSRRPTHRLS